MDWKGIDHISESFWSYQWLCCSWHLFLFMVHFQIKNYTDLGVIAATWYQSKAIRITQWHFWRENRRLRWRRLSRKSANTEQLMLIRWSVTCSSLFFLVLITFIWFVCFVENSKSTISSQFYLLVFLGSFLYRKLSLKVFRHLVQ